MKQTIFRDVLDELWKLICGKAEREQYDLSAFGIHWDHLNEDISVEGLLAGQGDLTKTPTQIT